MLTFLRKVRLRLINQTVSDATRKSLIDSEGQWKHMRSVMASIFILIAAILGVIFLSKIVLPVDFSEYFKMVYYSQFGPLAISIELLIAGFYLLIGNPKSNFTLALFGFTALLDPLFNTIGLFTSIVPVYASIIFFICALASLWIAFSNAFNLGRISFIGAFGSFLLGSAVELFFNYF